MYCKLPVLLALVLSIFCATAQRPDTFGVISDFEKQITVYEKDSSANALVLYERGDNYFKVVDRRVRLIKEYHVKIKIFNEKGFDQGTVSIPLKRNGSSYEKLTKIKAATHNENNQFNVLPSEIYTKDINEYRSVKTFSLPKLQKGSILEYTYTIISPFTYNFKGWNFQSHIPKLYSEFNAKIPGNYVYNRALTGSLKLDINDSKLKRNCFHIDGIAKSADCEVLKYAMKDIPAFKTEKDFMLAKSNYIARLDFELSQYNRFDGTTDKYTKTWKDVDKEFRSDANIGRQLTKKGFFEKNVPKELLTEGDAITRAKNIYKFVQDHYTWTGKYGVFGKARVKEAFENRKGSIGEINMSLINLLNAANIKTNLLLLSTRDEGLPKKAHPVMSDFNYSVAKAEIDGEDHLLDATDKYLPFGMLPFKALNHYGRVMDFKNESYWYDIEAQKKNKYQIRGHISFNIDDHKAYGVLDVINLGYDAVDLRKTINQYSEEEYLENIENGIQGDFSITSYEFVKERSNDEKVSERFKFELENVLNSNMVYFNPFLIRFFDQNPFLLEERNYPIDFGYSRNYKYQMNITVPDGYQVHELPENKTFTLGEKMAILKFYHLHDKNQIVISFDLTLNDTYFSANDYNSLKELFEHVTNIQNNSLVVLKKE